MTQEEAERKMGLYKNHPNFCNYDYRITEENEVFFLEIQALPCIRCKRPFWSRNLDAKPSFCPNCNKVARSQDGGYGTKQEVYRQEFGSSWDDDNED